MREAAQSGKILSIMPLLSVPTCSFTHHECAAVRHTAQSLVTTKPQAVISQSFDHELKAVALSRHTAAKSTAFSVYKEVKFETERKIGDGTKRNCYTSCDRQEGQPKACVSNLSHCEDQNLSERA